MSDGKNERVRCRKCNRFGGGDGFCKAHRPSFPTDYIDPFRDNPMPTVKRREVQGMPTEFGARRGTFPIADRKGPR